MSLLLSALIAIISFWSGEISFAKNPQIATYYEYDPSDFKVTTSYSDEHKKMLFSLIKSHDPQAVIMIEELMKTEPDIQYIRRENGATPFLYAAYHNNIEVLKAFYNNGADIHVRSYLQGNAIILATVGGSIEALKFLLGIGLDTNTIAYEQFTPLMLATLYNKKETVDFLLAHGADTSLKNSDNRTALDIAISKGYKDIEKSLRSYSLADE